ncbi:hypothetical protein NDU88_003436 [Pleurodeles waltl]|uniref:Uncharacterized protein n=1 Tax=Pleurodeles waltl TaxID=8319 RepID=A0AAV7UCI8_PLEWA|nr:hypothetical protein NDU88_003436 [Pleurodeles waltl]
MSTGSPGGCCAEAEVTGRPVAATRVKLVGPCGLDQHFRGAQGRDSTADRSLWVIEIVLILQETRKQEARYKSSKMMKKAENL